MSSSVRPSSSSRSTAYAASSSSVNSSSGPSSRASSVSSLISTVFSAEEGNETERGRTFQFMLPFFGILHVRIKRRPNFV